jgi:Na+-driven multidrug efflux pump
VLSIIVCIIGYIGNEFYLILISQHAETIIIGFAYLHCLITGMALQFIMVSISAALRGIGIIKPAMIIQTLPILLNIILSSILIN